MADRLDPPVSAPPREITFITRTELREVQMRGLRLIDDCMYLSRLQGDNEGLLWFPTAALDSINWLITAEIETRERDFAAVELDPGRVL